jgi:hypothetical protein
VVVRARRPLAEEDADELEAVLTDWYNLARLGAFRDDPRQPALEGYHAEQAPLADVTLCAEPPPAPAARRGAA